MAGYIDYDLYNQVENQMIVLGYKNYFNTLADFALLPIAEVATLSRFVFTLGLKKFFFTELEVAGIKEIGAKSLPRALCELPGPTTLTTRTVASFRAGIYSNRLLQSEETLYRYHGVLNRNAVNKAKDGSKFVWLTNKKFTSEEAMRRELAVRRDWPVTIDAVSTVRVPKGTWLSEGEAGAQGEGYPGGGYQVAIENVPNAWILRTDKPW
jgi:hypothetical protein